MIKKLKIGLLALALALFAGAGSASADALSFTSDVNIVVNSMTFTIHSGSTGTSLAVGGASDTTFTAVVPTGETWVVSNAAGYSLANNASLSQTCTGTGSAVTVAGAATVIFTPVATACTPVGGGAGLASGGGGGGSTDATAPTAISVSINSGALIASTLSATLTLAATDNALVTQMMVGNDANFTGSSWEAYATSKLLTLVSGDGVKTVYAKFRDAAGNVSATVSDTITVSGSGTVAPAVTTPVTNVIPGCNGTAGFSTSTGQSCATNTAPATTTTSATTTPATTLTVTSVPNIYNLGKVTLRNGSRGEAVKELQRLLNKLLNLGLAVDGKLGPKTIAVIKTWQKNHKLVADGLVGAKTKAAMKTEAEK